jgi:CRISPR-associated protein Cas1
MLKRTILCSTPAYLMTSREQMVIELRDGSDKKATVPIEDIGVVVLEHPHISLTSSLLEKLSYWKVAVITCDEKYMPSGIHLPLEGHSEQTERIRHQIKAAVPLKKQLWMQTVKAKIVNQAALLGHFGFDNKLLLNLKDKVRSGDITNCEAQAAAFYWHEIYGRGFTRTRGPEYPNAQLNYGYAILRSVVARALVASGLLPSVGIHHKNKYNAFCLADDIMEPYRPIVDRTVMELTHETDNNQLTKEHRIELLKILQTDVWIDGIQRPLFHAVSTTTASLSACYYGEIKKIKYPDLFDK